MGYRSKGAHTAMSCIVLSPTVGALNCSSYEEQFNAPTTGDRTRLNASLLAVGNMYCFMVLGDL